MFAVTEYAYEMIKEINEEFHPDVSIFNQSQISQLSFWKEAYPVFYDVSNIFFSKQREQSSRLLIQHSKACNKK